MRPQAKGKKDHHEEHEEHEGGSDAVSVRWLTQFKVLPLLLLCLSIRYAVQSAAQRRGQGETNTRQKADSSSSLTHFGLSLVLSNAVLVLSNAVLVLSEAVLVLGSAGGMEA